jgi:Na+-driven multidrug efflux pump
LDVNAVQTPVNSSSHARPLIDGAITPTLARFALPLLTTNLLHMLTTTWGAIWVSHVLGANALTAVVTANLFSQMMMGAANGLGSACGVAIGQSLGAGDRSR